MVLKENKNKDLPYEFEVFQECWLFLKKWAGNVTTDELWKEAIDEALDIVKKHNRDKLVEQMLFSAILPHFEVIESKKETSKTA